MQDRTVEYPTVAKYDRVREGLRGIAVFTRASTVKTTAPVVGSTVTYVVESARHEDGDYIFVECIDDQGVVRLVLPPKVAAVIASQREALTARRRSIASKATAKARADRGELPGFMRKKKAA